MTTVATDGFGKMNIMAGTARSLETSKLSEDDRKVWNRDFDLLVTDLKNIIDPQLGADLEGEKDFYTSVCEIAKGYFNEKPFGGLKASTGQYGFRMLGPQDLRTAASSASPAFYSWRQTVWTTSAKTYKQYALGYGTAAVFAQNDSEKKEVLGFHRLISFTPSPRIIQVQFTVNSYPYPPYNVELFSKIGKDGKSYKIIPMPARVVLHPGGSFFVHLYFDLQGGASAPSGQSAVDVEVAPFGLVFGEFDYLDAANLT